MFQCCHYNKFINDRIWRFFLSWCLRTVEWNTWNHSLLLFFTVVSYLVQKSVRLEFDYFFKSFCENTCCDHSSSSPIITSAQLWRFFCKLLENLFSEAAFGNRGVLKSNSTSFRERFIHQRRAEPGGALTAWGTGTSDIWLDLSPPSQQGGAEVGVWEYWGSSNTEVLWCSHRRSVWHVDTTSISLVYFHHRPCQSDWGRRSLGRENSRVDERQVTDLSINEQKARP